MLYNSNNRCFSSQQEAEDALTKYAKNNKMKIVIDEHYGSYSPRAVKGRKSVVVWHIGNNKYRLMPISDSEKGTTWIEPT